MIRRIAEDKWRHFFVGIEIGVLCQSAAVVLLPSHLFIGTGASLLIVIIIGYGFELYSKLTGHGHYEMLDAIAAVIGGTAAIVITLVLYLLLG